MKSVLHYLFRAITRPQADVQTPAELDSTEAQQEWENEILNAEVTKKAISLSRMQEHLPKLITEITPCTDKKVDAYYLNHLKTLALDSLKSDTINAKCFIDLHEHAVKPKILEPDRLVEAKEAAIWLQRLDGFNVKNIDSDFLDEIMRIFDSLLK